MSKIKNIALGLIVAMCFCLSLLPASVLAVDDNDSVTARETRTVTVDIAEYINMRLESHSELGTRTSDCSSTTGSCTDTGGLAQSVSTTITTATRDITSMYTNIYVSTNNPNGFTLTVSDVDNDTTLRSALNDTISAISSEPVATTNPGWAISKDSRTTWLAVPAANQTPLTLKNYEPSESPITVDNLTTINYGVATSDSQAVGVYTDAIVYTATSN